MPEAREKREMSACHGETLKYAEEFMDAFVYPRW